MKIIYFVGARPQFIKAATVSKAWQGRGEQFILHTGQHYSDNMSRLFFSELQIPEPHINLEIGSNSLSECILTDSGGIQKKLICWVCAASLFARRRNEWKPSLLAGTSWPGQTAL